MFKLLFLLSLVFPLFSQVQALPPKPNPPKNVVIQIKVDGVRDEIELSTESIEVLNNFWYQNKVTGNFSQLFEKMITDIAKQLLSREDLAPENIKTQLRAVKAAEDAAKTMIENKSQVKSKKRVE